MRFNLAPTDPRFLDSTPLQIFTEFYAHQAFTRPNELHDEDTDFDASVAEFMEGEEWEDA